MGHAHYSLVSRALGSHNLLSLSKKPAPMTKTNTLSILCFLILAGVCGMALGVHVLVERLEAEQDGSALVINVAGRQRMLSQRVTLFAGAFVRTGNATHREHLWAAIDLMQEQHDQLVHSEEGTPFAARLTPALVDLYGPQGLNAEVEQFLDSARAIASGQSDDDARHLALLMALASSPMLDKLDRAVSHYQADSETTLDTLHRIENWIFTILMLSLLAEAFLIAGPLMRLTSGLHRLAMTDELTALPNRRYFMNACRDYIGASKDAPHPSALLLLDIDDFKVINDRYGHDAGDAVLKTTAQALREHVRQQDLVGRLGGEEFGVLFTGLTLQQAIDASERLVRNIARVQSHIEPHTTLTITFSGGLTPLSPMDDVQVALKRADELLYQAKNNGKAHVAYPLHAVPAPSLTASERHSQGERSERDASLAASN